MSVLFYNNDPIRGSNNKDQKPKKFNDFDALLLVLIGLMICYQLTYWM